jgi:hypothetical protein
MRWLVGRKGDGSFVVEVWWLFFCLMDRGGLGGRRGRCGFSLCSGIVTTSILGECTTTLCAETCAGRIDTSNKYYSMRRPKL